MFILVGISLSSFALLGFFVMRDGNGTVTVARAETTELTADLRPLAGSLGAGGALDAVPYAPLEPELFQVTSSAQLHMGPGELYIVIGMLPRGAEVDVTGRDQTGTWLAVSFGALNGWLPASKVPSVNISLLDTAPITLIQ